MDTDQVEKTMQTSEDLLSVKFKEEEHPKRKSNTNTPVRKSKTHLKLPQIERFTSDA